MGVSFLVIIYARFGGNHQHISSTYVQTINTLRHDYEVTSIEQETSLRDTFNTKVEALCLQKKLYQA